MPSDPKPEMEPQTESEPVDSEELPDPDDSGCVCGTCEFQEFTFTERYVKIHFIYSMVNITRLSGRFAPIL